MSSVEDCALGPPITLLSLPLFHLIIPMDSLEDTFPLYNVILGRSFPFPRVLEHWSRRHSQPTQS